MLANAKTYSLALLVTSLLVQGTPLPLGPAAAAAPLLEMTPGIIGGLAGAGRGGSGVAGMAGGPAAMAAPIIGAIGDLVNGQPENQNLRNTKETTDSRQHRVDTQGSQKKDYDFSGTGLDKIRGNKPKPWQRQGAAEYADSYYGQRRASEDFPEALVRRELDTRSPKGGAGHTSTGRSAIAKAPASKAPASEAGADTQAAIQMHDDKKAERQSKKEYKTALASQMTAESLPYAMQAGATDYEAQKGYGAGAAAAYQDPAAYGQDPSASATSYQDPATNGQDRSAQGGYASDPNAAQGYPADPSGGAAPAASGNTSNTNIANTKKQGDSSTQQVSTGKNKDKTMTFRRWISERAESSPPAPAAEALKAEAPKPNDGKPDGPKPDAPKTDAPKPSEPANPSKSNSSDSSSSKAASPTISHPPVNAPIFPIVLHKSTSSPSASKSSKPTASASKEHKKTKTSSSSQPQRTLGGDSYTSSETKNETQNIDQSNNGDYSTTDSSDHSQNQKVGVQVAGNLIGDNNGNQYNCPPTQMDPMEFCADNPQLCIDIFVKQREGKKNKAKKSQHGNGRRQVILGDLEARGKGQGSGSSCICSCYTYGKRSVSFVNPNAFAVPKGCSVERKNGHAVYGGKLCPIAGKQAVHK